MRTRSQTIKNESIDLLDTEVRLNVREYQGLGKGAYLMENVKNGQFVTIYPWFSQKCHFQLILFCVVLTV